MTRLPGRRVLMGAPEPCRNTSPDGKGSGIELRDAVRDPLTEPHRRLRTRHGTGRRGRASTVACR
ncbi:hypothetical protein GCM10018773_54200 [Streptomyces candidus]|nr:hypothetical protein GCM10018773_54200 [Streptomyces candidus]